VSRPRRVGRLFSALALMVIGATVTLLLNGVTGSGRAPGEPGPVDIGFAQDMVVHHQQAVAMAQAVHGRVGPSVQQLATGIELNQLREIGHLQGWLALWDAPQLPSGPPMTWMDGPGHHTSPSTGHDMPGLASQEEVNRLADLEDEALEAAFLRLMIRHHEGGLLMTTAAARNAAIPHVRAFAKAMTLEQRRETATMAALLSSLEDGSRPVSD
jgi:uncharacterized protein (DUF305 family)